MTNSLAFLVTIAPTTVYYACWWRTYNGMIDKIALGFIVIYDGYGVAWKVFVFPAPNNDMCNWCQVRDRVSVKESWTRLNCQAPEEGGTYWNYMTGGNRWVSQPNFLSTRTWHTTKNLSWHSFWKQKQARIYIYVLSSGASTSMPIGGAYM